MIDKQKTNFGPTELSNAPAGAGANSGQAAPWLSIVVAVRNGAATLQRLIDSCAAQSEGGWELVVMDGLSTDGTIDILAANAAAISYCESSVDTGIYHAWNKGLAHARGDWICFLGADDRFHGSNVVRRLNSVRQSLPPPIRVIYGQVALVDAGGALIELLGRPWAEVRHRFLQLMSIPHPGALHHKSMFADFGGFDESFRIAGDYEFLLRELINRDAHFENDLVTVDMAIGGVSSSPGALIPQLLETRAAQVKHGLGRPGPAWRWAMCKARMADIVQSMIGIRGRRILADAVRMASGKPRFWTR